jgi:L-asparaginase
MRPAATGDAGAPTSAAPSPAAPPPAAAAGAQGAATATSGVPRVLVLATGGTIAGKANANSAIGYDAGQVTGKDLIAAVPGIEKLANLSTYQVSNIGSQDMNDAVWLKLAARMNDAFAKNEADAVVVTHGTDTLEETAFFLEQVIASDKPVVIVGAMRPSTAISADGPANLYEGVKLAASPDARGRGVLVVVNDTIHETRDVTKSNTTSLQTFISPNVGPAGSVDAASIRFFSEKTSYPRPRFTLPAASPLPRVDIIYSHSNMTPDPINEAVKGGAKGLVLAGVGDGNSSKSAIGALSEAAKKGVVVVRSSRVGSGFTNRNAELNDDELGFAASMDLNPQKSRILLQLLLASGVKDIKKVQAAFELR